MTERSENTAVASATPGSADPRPIAPAARPQGTQYDRSIIEGPLGAAVWRLAWPTMLQNAIGGLQGIIDHAMVGHYVGFAANAAIGVSWQIFLVVIVFVSSLFTGMSVLVARFAGARDTERVNRTVYQAFLTAVALSLAVLAPIGYALAPMLLGLVNAAPEVRAQALPYFDRLIQEFEQSEHLEEAQKRVELLKAEIANRADPDKAAPVKKVQ